VLVACYRREDILVEQTSAMYETPCQRKEGKRARLAILHPSGEESTVSHVRFGVPAYNVPVEGLEPSGRKGDVRVHNHCVGRLLSPRVTQNEVPCVRTAHVMRKSERRHTLNTAAAASNAAVQTAATLQE